MLSFLKAEDGDVDDSILVGDGRVGQPHFHKAGKAPQSYGKTIAKIGEYRDLLGKIGASEGIRSAKSCKKAQVDYSHKLLIRSILAPFKPEVESHARRQIWPHGLQAQSIRVFGLLGLNVQNLGFRAFPQISLV